MTIKGRDAYTDYCDIQSAYQLRNVLKVCTIKSKIVKVNVMQRELKGLLFTCDYEPPEVKEVRTCEVFLTLLKGI